MVQPQWKIIWWFLTELNIELSCDPSMPLLSIYLRELKARTETDICMPMFILTLFAIAKMWKQSKCASIGEWINKMCIRTMEYYSVIRRNEIGIRATT